MPQTEIVYFQEGDGTVPVLEWLKELRLRQERAFAKCVARIERLAEAGYELRRPEADMLDDGIYELRIRDGNVQHRLLYFFHGRNISILAHALTKTDVVAPADMKRARERKQRFESDPERHTYHAETSHEEDAKRPPDSGPDYR